ncbi:MAG: aminotransferase class I/II-fold pyridoxal phosphate-dependent enzyme, partial [Verrucomicrobia bacterium]|nr:aminotransferase class I/II-fold pyridoxal phosphate-dependent enzyme [Verrucomicrobiota bacterium]
AALEAAMRKIQDTLVICPPVISQYAALGALSAGLEYVREGVRGIAAVRALVQRELAPLAADGLCEIPPADGALYFFLRVRSDRPPLELVERLVREHRVAVIPGDAFGVTHGCPLRVAYGALAQDTAIEGLGRLARGLRALVG